MARKARIEMIGDKGHLGYKTSTVTDDIDKAVCSVNCECKTGEDCYGDAALNLFELEESGRNWQEDYPHENGNYLNECVYCKLIFIGHKRRVVCKLCSK